MLVYFICLVLSLGNSPKTEVFHENLNDLLNDGINSTTFLEYNKNIPFFKLMYDSSIDQISNPLVRIYDDTDLEELSSQILVYLDLAQTLNNVNPELANRLKLLNKQFSNVKPLISELGPHLSKVLNLNFEVINKLYDYILINKENDGIIFGNILKILEIPPEKINQLYSFISFFEDSQTLLNLFSELDVLPQYYNFILKVRSLKIPKNPRKRFYSYNRILDAVDCFLDLVISVIQKINTNYPNGFKNALRTNFLIKMFNFSEVSLAERISEFNEVIKISKNYILSCMEDSDSPQCTLYAFGVKFMSHIICQTTGNLCFEEEDDALALINSYFSLYKNLFPNKKEENEVKQDININKQDNDANRQDNDTSKQDENKFFELVNNIFNLYLAAIEILSILNPKIHFGLPKSAIRNFFKIYRSQIDDSYNFKLYFDYLNMNKQWILLRNIINQIEQNKTICELYLSSEECNDIYSTIIDKTQLLTSDKSVVKSLSEERADYFVNALLPFLKSLSSDLNESLLKLYKLTTFNSPYKEKVHDVNFTKFVYSLCTVFEKSITIFIEIKPEFSKVLKMIKNNENVNDIIKSISPSLSVFVEKLINAANSYVDENTTFETMTKSMISSTLYQALCKISKLENLTLKSLFEAITNDLDDECSEIKSIRSILMNLDVLANEMNKDKLDIKTISILTGVDKEKLIQFSSKYIKKYAIILRLLPPNLQFIDIIIYFKWCYCSRINL